MYFLRLDLRGGRGCLPVDRTLVIGRSNTADLILDAPTISRIHCRLCLQGDTLTIEDLGSQSGTHHNGQLITASTPLAVGDIIHIGTFSLVIEDEERRPRRQKRPAIASIETSDDILLPSSPGPDLVGAAHEAAEPLVLASPPSQPIAALSTADDLDLAELEATAPRPAPAPKAAGLVTHATTIDIAPPTWASTPGHQDVSDETSTFDEETAPHEPPPPSSWPRKKT